MLTTALKRTKKYPKSYQNSKKRNKEHRRAISAHLPGMLEVANIKKKRILNRKIDNAVSKGTSE